MLPAFFQVPLIVRPFVEIQARPLPMYVASRRCFVEPSLSGANRTATVMGPLGGPLFYTGLWVSLALYCAVLTTASRLSRRAVAAG